MPYARKTEPGIRHKERLLTAEKYVVVRAARQVGRGKQTCRPPMFARPFGQAISLAGRQALLYCHVLHKAVEPLSCCFFLQESPGTLTKALTTKENRSGMTQSTSAKRMDFMTISLEPRLGELLSRGLTFCLVKTLSVEHGVRKVGDALSLKRKRCITIIGGEKARRQSPEIRYIHCGNADV